MKIAIPLNKSHRLINSGEVILVTSCYKDKKNIVTLAWHMPMSSNPAIWGICVAKKHLTSELIEKSKEFAVNVPALDLLTPVIYCGSHSGREVDKFPGSNLSEEKANCLTRTPLIKECDGHIECRVRDIKEVGDHNLFIAETVSASALEETFEDVWKIDKSQLIYHLGGKYFTSPKNTVKI